MQNDENSKWHPVIYFDWTNLNGRRYESKSISADVMNSMKKLIVDKRFIGEIGHPDQGHFLTLTNMSHVVEDVVIHSDIMFAKIKPLSTIPGKSIQDIQNTSGPHAMVFRPRGIGTVGEDGVVNLETIVSFDAIPANTDSFKESQDIYNEIVGGDRTPDQSELGDINLAFQRKNSNGSKEQ